MSGDIPVSLVLSSCPHDEVRPLLAALVAHDLDTTCNNHDVDACVQLGTRSTDWEAYTEDVHDLYEDLRRAAPHAGLAVVGGASEAGPGILRLNHPVLGDYPRRVPTQDDRPAPLFTPTEVRSILASVAGKPNGDQLLSLALGEPWSEQLHTLPDPYSCQTVATADRLPPMPGPSTPTSPTATSQSINFCATHAAHCGPPPPTEPEAASSSNMRASTAGSSSAAVTGTTPLTG
ncbi:hypothetical protein ACFXI0_07895 [Kitasatospora indigofera]|uniref:hypothetical protein n=1 Tax=Kitasatospora indigofera TaxID=67307 RepID=UPI00367628A8